MPNEEKKIDSSSCGQLDQITNDETFNNLIIAYNALSNVFDDFMFSNKNFKETDAYLTGLNGGKYAIFRGYLKRIKHESKCMLKIMKSFEDDSKP